MLSQLLEQKLLFLSSELALKIGPIEAIIFQKLYSCLTNPNMVGTEKDGRKWIRNPIECRDTQKLERAQEHGKAIDWLSNFPFLTIHKIRRIFAKLEGLGLVLSRKLRASKWDHCKYYSINQDKLTELLEVAPLSICANPTNRSGKTEHIDLAHGHKSYQTTLSNPVFQELERDGAVDFLNEEKKEAIENQEFLTDETQEFAATQEVCQFDQFSATVAPTDLTIDPVAAESQAMPGNDELHEFQRQLADLGDRLGKQNPEAWAYKIADNLGNGKLCVYWEEFKAGRPLGSTHQKEWEITPGVPFPIVVQFLEQDFLARPGTTKEEAAREAGRVIKNPTQMTRVWQAIKSRIVLRSREWEKQKALGVQTPYVDPGFIEQPSVSREEAAIALHELHSALPPALQSVGSPALQPAQEILPVSEGEVEEAISNDNPAEENGISAVFKTKICATLSKFARPGKGTKRSVLEENIKEIQSMGFVATVEKVEPDRSSKNKGDYIPW